MNRFILALIIFAVIIIALIVLVYRTRKGKTKCVREYYACQCVVLLIGLAGDTIYAFSSGYSIWDILAVLLGIEIQEPIALSLLNKIFIFAVFVICYLVVRQVYREWAGPISRRQFQMETEMLEDSHILVDCFVILSSLFKHNYELKTYKSRVETVSYRSEITNETPWHLEFADIYSLMSNQAHIDKAKDWHALNRCYISSFADEKRIAIFCSLLVPTPAEVDTFLDYIYQHHNAFYEIIIAVKEGKREDTVQPKKQEVKYIFKEEALNKLVDFTEYYRAVDSLYQRPLMQNTSMKIEDVYVEPECCLENGETTFQLFKYVTNWLQEDGMRQLALLGEFGQGKTLFSTYLTYHLVHEPQNERIPILIPLRNKSPRNCNEIEILSYFAAQYGISPEALRILNANGKLLLIFDGFDEMDLVGNDDIRKRHFQSLWKLVQPKSKVLITGRPNYFLDRNEMASALGFQSGTKDLPYCEGLLLQPFRQEQIVQALRASKETVRSGIKHILDNQISDSFVDLISRPSHLFLISQIWEERKLEQRYQNLTSAIVINEFLQNCFERQTSKGESEPYFFLSPIEREYFMIGIAVRMYKSGATSISQDSFYNTVLELLDMFPEKLSAENSMFLNFRNGKTVRDFAKDDENSLLAIVNDVRTCGILVNDTANSGLCFAHKSFYDLLVAKFFLGKSLKLHNASMTISNAISKANAYHPRLKNDFVVRKLLAELVSAEIDVRMEHSGEKLKCLKIFEQCKKAFSYHGLRRSPQKMFLYCIREELNEQERSVIERWIPRRESIRLCYFGGVVLLVCVVFLIRCINIGQQYGEEARLYFSNVAITGETSDFTIGLINSILPYLPLIFLCAIVVVAFYILSSKIALSAQGKTDLILFTWYYACKENEVSDNVILKQFSKNYGNAFMAYVQGEKFNKVQKQLEMSQKRRPCGRKDKQL